MSNHFRLICGVLGIVFLGAAIAWFGQYERQQRQQQVESTIEAIGTQATIEQIKEQLPDLPASGQ